MQFLITLYSKLSNAAAIGVVESDRGLIYLQRERFPEKIFHHQLRGIAAWNDQVYVVTPATLRLYRFAPDNRGAPWFILEKEIVRPEWLGGDTSQGDLLPLCVLPDRQRVVVAANGLGTIDEFSLAGDFITRRHLSDICPSLVSRLPVSKKYPYGHIRCLFKGPVGELWASIASVNGAETGCILDLDSGRIVMSNLRTPRDALCTQRAVFCIDVQGGELLSHEYDGGQVHGVKWKVAPSGIDASAKSHITLRGLVTDGERVFSIAQNLAKASKKWFAPNLISFDVTSGRQRSAGIALPDFEDFREPQCVYLATIAPQLSQEYMKKQPVPAVLGMSDKVVSGIRSQASDDDETDERGKLPSRSITANRAVAISVQGAAVCYRRGARVGFGRIRGSREFWALSDISFEIREGESVGLIGRNGSGKSTLGMLLSGTLSPDRGAVRTYGKVQLLSLGVGFRNELTGRDNVFISGTLLGMTRELLIEKMPEIEAFSELGPFLDEPMRTYSAGMRSRLAFAVATAVEPDTLILDEVLSTGDKSFRDKAESRMRMMRDKAKTVIMVSHSSNQLQRLCSRVIWLESGRLMLDGSPKEVLHEYERFCNNPAGWFERHPERRVESGRG